MKHNHDILIVKSLSRSGGTGQLVRYLFKYMLNEEKRQYLPEELMPYIEQAKKYQTAKEFEEAMNEEGLLQYHGAPHDFTSVPNTASDVGSTFGNGFYLSRSRHIAKRQAMGKNGVVKKYLLNPLANFFDAGKKEAAYRDLGFVLARNIPHTANLVAELDTGLRLQLESQGYAGVVSPKATIVFDPAAIHEMPKDFFRQAKRYSVKALRKQDAVREQLAARPKGLSPIVIRHNVPARTIKGYIKAFERNEANRVHKRKNSVQVYHTILSFSNLDKEHVNEKVLKDMAKKYIELRGKDNLYVITPHFDKDHIHLHCAMSGTKLNGLSSRISRKEFSDIKVALDNYQRQQYPLLVHSLPNHSRKNKEQSKDYALKNIKSERCLDKDILIQLLETTYAKSTSQGHFLAQLAEQGHVPYYRSGKLTGLKFNGERKFRLNRLGYDEAKLQELGKVKVQEPTKEVSIVPQVKQPEPIQQALPFAEKLQGSAEQSQSELQALVDSNKEFEKANNISPASRSDSKEVTQIALPDTKKEIDKIQQQVDELSEIRQRNTTERTMQKPPATLEKASKTNDRQQAFLNELQQIRAAANRDRDTYEREPDRHTDSRDNESETGKSAEDTTNGHYDRNNEADDDREQTDSDQ